MTGHGFSGCLKRLAEHRAVLFARFVWRRFDDTGLMQAAGSLTFTTLLALVPVLAVMLVVVMAVPVFADTVDAFLAFVNNTILPSGAAAVGNYLNEFKMQAAKLTAIGIAAMLVTALMLVQTIDQTFNRIWAVRRQRSWWVRLPAYCVLLVFLPAVAGLSLTVSTLLLLPFETLSGRYVWFSGSLKLVWQLGLDTLALALLYRLVPNCHVPLRHALGGALFTAVLLKTAKWGFGVYLAHFNSYERIYGAFAVVPVFLIWLHLLWTIVLLGALLTACAGYWRGGAFLRSNDKHTLFDDGVAVAVQLAAAQGSMRVREIRQQTHIGYDRIETVLRHFSGSGLARHGKGGWQLTAPPDQITLADIFALLVYHPQHAAGSNLERVMQPCMAQLDISLAQLAQQGSLKE